VLVTHGGPCTGLFQTLTGSARSPPTGYCGLFAYVLRGGGGGGGGRWEAVVEADHEHLWEVSDATISGPSDMSEQATQEPSAPTTIAADKTAAAAPTTTNSTFNATRTTNAA
jgi:hypothetical protein